MPRRPGPKCSRRSAGRDHIDQTVELNLVWGDCFGHWDIRTRAEFVRHWLRWGEAITRRWVAAYPGSRPMAAYIVGEIAPPAWVSPPPCRPTPLRLIDGCTVVIPDITFHRGEPELEHLDRLGLIEDDEHELALERLAQPDARDHGRYRGLYWDRPERHLPHRHADDIDDGAGGYVRPAPPRSSF
jgi:hypothetical protein